MLRKNSDNSTSIIEAGIEEYQQDKQETAQTQRQEEDYILAVFAHWEETFDGKPPSFIEAEEAYLFATDPQYREEELFVGSFF